MNKQRNIFMKLIMNNPCHIFWFILYFDLSIRFFGGYFSGITPTVILYITSIIIALSPLGETIFRFIERVRPLYTKQEKEYLLPIFEEVYSEAKAEHPKLEEIEICTIDTVAINACAIGKHTIAVSKGAIETFSTEELKAIIAHEISHIINGDTIATLLTTIGNGIFTVFVLILKAILILLDLVTGELKGSAIMIAIIRFVFYIVIFCFKILGDIILSIGNRKNEYRADRFAYYIGYGKDMVEALYLLEKLTLNAKASIIMRITANHPILAKRIGRIETLLARDE